MCLVFRFQNKSILTYITELLFGLMRHLKFTKLTPGNCPGLLDIFPKSPSVILGAKEAEEGEFKTYQRKPESRVINFNKRCHTW